MMRRIVGCSGLLIVFTLAMANIAQAQNAETPSQSINDISNLLDSFTAESVELTEEQEDLYSDELFNFTVDPAATEEVRKIWLDLLTKSFGAEAAIETEKGFGPDTVQELAGGLFGDSGFKVSNFFDVNAMQILIDLIIAQNLNSTPTTGDIAVRDGIVSAVNSAMMQEQRGKSNAQRQVSQQITALGTLLRFYTFTNERNAGKPTDELATAAQTRLIEKWSIDPRFQVLTDDGMGLSTDFKDILYGKKNLKDVYPDLDFEQLSKAPSAEMTQILANALLKFSQSGDLADQSDNSSDKPNGVPVEAKDDANTNSANANPLAPTPATEAVADAVNPLAASTSAFAGQFQGDGLSLSLEINDGDASGVLSFNDQQYSVEGIVNENSMTGHFKTDAGEFPFEAFAEPDKIRFETGGASYNLTGQ